MWRVDKFSVTSEGELAPASFVVIQCRNTAICQAESTLSWDYTVRSQRASRNYD